MMRLALVLIVLAQAKPGPFPPPALDEKSYKTWSQFIRPSEAELKWKKIPWRTDLAAAAAEAKALNRPILLWADQGNPLGLVDMAPLGGDPAAAAGKPSPDVRDDRAVRRKDEAYQLIGRSRAARDDAGAVVHLVQWGHRSRSSHAPTA